jgi:predicted Zn-ribbon and HTH transcriptional regulator
MKTAMIQITNNETGAVHYNEIDNQFRCTMQHTEQNVFKAYPATRYTITLLDANQVLVDMGRATYIHTVASLTCTRCSHTWAPRSDKRPSKCPACTSPYWDKPRRSGKGE